MYQQTKNVVFVQQHRPTLAAATTKLDVFLIVLTGLLINTSIYNLDSFGIPLFYVAAFFAFLVLVSQYTRSPLLLPAKSSLVLGGILLLVLVTIVSLHSFLGLGVLSNEIRQLIARSAFIGYMVLAAVIIAQKSAVHTAYNYLKNLLKFFFLYGLYEVIAKIFGLPLFLEFLRNSASYAINREVTTGGWLNTYRIQSIWFEPSASAIPLGIFLFLLVFHSSKREKVVWGLLSAVYCFFTYSRLAWATYVALVAFIIVIYLIKRLDRRVLYGLVRIFRAPLLVSLLATSMLWIFATSDLFTDLSSAGRTTSIIIGTRIFMDYPINGTGFNTYRSYENRPEYRRGLEEAPSEFLVHNLFVSYAQQMGVLGILYALIPILYLLFLNHLSLEKRLFVALLFGVAGVFGGDIYYLPLTWLIIGLMAANHYQESKKNKNALVKV